MCNQMPAFIVLTNSNYEMFTSYSTVHALCIHAKEIKNEFDVSAHWNLQFPNGKGNKQRKQNNE